MIQITYGFYDSPFGEMVIGKSAEGLCWLGFMVNGYKGDGLSRMKDHFKGAEFVHDDAAVRDLGAQVLQIWEQGAERKAANDLPFDLQGTDFQKQVWTALLNIPKGQVQSYGDLAQAIGKPKASRAVGSAVGANPVSLLVPCHRVLPQAGGVGNYGWGPDLKEKLLAAEKAA